MIASAAPILLFFAPARSRSALPAIRVARRPPCTARQLRPPTVNPDMKTTIRLDKLTFFF